MPGSSGGSGELAVGVQTSHPASLFDRAHRLTTAGLLMLVTFVAFESMAVATAMPTAVAELHGLAWYGWPFSAFLVASVVGMVIGGDVGDRRGPGAALLGGVGLFAAGLLVAGLSGNMALFVGARAVQGVGAGAIAVSIYVVSGQAYEAALRPRLFGAISAAWVLPALVGPLVAGLLTAHASWRLVFLGLLPLIGLGLALVLPAVRQLAVPHTDAVPDPARRWWAVLAGTGIGALQYAGQRLDLVAVGIAVLGAVLLTAALRALLPPGTARVRRGLPAVVATRGLLAGAFFGMDALLPLAMTQLHGYSPAAAGVPLTAGALGWAAASHLQGRRPDVPRVSLLRLGFLLLAAGLAATAAIAVPGVGGWPAYLSWAVAGLGMGFAMPSVGVLLLDQSPQHRRGADSSAFQIADVTGSALTVGVVGILVAATTASLLALSTAVLAAVAVLTALALLGALLAPRAGAPAATPALPDGATTLAPS
jgi:MFS family permease